MRILLTGTTGFLGSHTLKHLLQRGYEIAVLIRPHSDTWRIEELLPHTLQITGDANHPESAAESICHFKPEAVAHLAWEGVMNSARNNPDQIYTNLPGSLKLLKIAVECGCNTWVGMGSQAEYGPAEQIITEQTPALPTTLYGASKLSTGLLTYSLCNHYLARFVWLRLFSSYGPMDQPQWMLPYLILTLLRGEKPALTEGKQLWDFIYIEDAAEAVCQAIANPDAKGVFNLGSGEARPLRETIEIVRNAINPALPLGFGETPYRPDQVMHLQADITRLKAIGWSPQTSLEAGLARTVEWYRDNKHRYIR